MSEQRPSKELVTLQAPAGETWLPADPVKCMEVLRSLATGAVSERDFNCAYLAAFAVHQIERLQKRVAELERQNQTYCTLIADLKDAAARAAHEPPDEQRMDYAIKLQRLIEAFCGGRWLPYPELYHHKLLLQARITQPPAGCPVHGECPICKAQAQIGDPRTAVTGSSLTKSGGPFGCIHDSSPTTWCGVCYPDKCTATETSGDRNG